MKAWWRILFSYSNPGAKVVQFNLIKIAWNHLMMCEWCLKDVSKNVRLEWALRLKYSKNSRDMCQHWFLFEILFGDVDSWNKTNSVDVIEIQKHFIICNFGHVSSCACPDQSTINRTNEQLFVRANNIYMRVLRSRVSSWDCCFVFLPWMTLKPILRDGSPQEW